MIGIGCPRETERRCGRDAFHHGERDNGPWLAQKVLGGSSGPFRDGKGTTFEGGVRVPALFLWPDTVKPGVVGEMGAFFDLLPTFAALAGAALSADRVLDGGDLTPVLRGTGASPRHEYLYYRGSTLQAVRSGAYKAHFVTREEGWDQSPKMIDPPWLYNLDTDPAERYDLAAERPTLPPRSTEQAIDSLRLRL